ncbi:hypothetical protein OXPF_05160 [Oxobacter pfennigii]|uniref:Uncharacterized protein n=1 Tax=Oxobacter pfennigii TaxID=36849 RepID=A0A0P8Z1S0_9CLOT|nr:hypothetical protein [Oxobacter pfennigii]KPU46035.1 hypothetical protein OXPF_05160 [Oxobacter pfennigii]
MKALTKIFIVIFFIACICYYFDINVKEIITQLIENKEVSSIINPDSNESEADNSSVTFPENNEEVPAIKEGGAYDEIINFIINQKKERSLIESYRVVDDAIGGALKGRSYATDNAIAAITLINHGTEEANNGALSILEGLSSIQNSDGSWYDFYDTAGKVMKVNGEDYISTDTGNNSLILYAYSYYTIKNKDERFLDAMKKSADYILKKTDNISQGLYDTIVGEDGTRTMRTNVYGYFALRDYALCNINTNYDEYREKLFASYNIMDWIISNCYDNGVFIKGYSGKEKLSGLNLDSQLLGAMTVLSLNQSDKISYEAAQLIEALDKLNKDIGATEGYRIDDSEGNGGYIWGQGTSKASIALLKFNEAERAGGILKNIEEFQNTVSTSLLPRGVPHSSNLDNKIDIVNLESVSSSCWAALAFQCSMDEGINNMFFGDEEYVFSRMR